MSLHTKKQSCILLFLFNPGWAWLVGWGVWAWQFSRKRDNSSLLVLLHDDANNCQSSISNYNLIPGQTCCHHYYGQKLVTQYVKQD
jgi:hypothetical protein